MEIKMPDVFFGFLELKHSPKQSVGQSVVASFRLKKRPFHFPIPKLDILLRL